MSAPEIFLIWTKYVHTLVLKFWSFLFYFVLCWQNYFVIIESPTRAIIDIENIDSYPMQVSVMWSETVGLRTRPVWNQNGLAGLLLCCETRSCHARRHDYYYYRVLRSCAYVVSQSTAASSASCKLSRPPSNLVNGQELTMCDIVWISLQSHSSLSVKPHFLWHALQWPWPVRKWFSSDHWRRRRSKPEVGLWGLPLKWNWPP